MSTDVCRPDLLELVDCGVTLRDASARLLYANAAARALLPPGFLAHGEPPPEELGYLRADGSQYEPAQLPMRQTLRTGEPFRDQVVGVRRPQGDVTWLLVSGSPMRDPDGKIAGLVTTLHELTALRRAPQAASVPFSESPGFAAAVLRTLAEGVVVHDGDGSIVYNNLAAERILGLDAEQLRGRRAIDPRWKLVRPDGTPLRPDEIPSEVTRLTGRACRSVILGVVRGDERGWLSVSTEPLPGEGNRVVATLADITAERRAFTDLEASRSRLAAATEGIPGAIYQYLIPAEGPERFTFLAGRALFPGLTNEQVLADPARATSLVDPRDEAIIAAERLAAAAEAGRFDAEFRLSGAHGPLWRRAQATSQTSPEGVLWTGLILDVDEQKRMAEALQRARQREAMGDLAAGVAHNFNNMLAAVLPNLEALRERLPEPAPELDESLLAVRQAAELVRELMRFSRSESEPGALRPLDLCAAVQDVVRLARRTFDRSIQLEVRFETLQAPVTGVPSQVQQLVLNLLLNARDALRAVPEPRISVRVTEEQAPAGRLVRLEVADNGCGMDEEVVRRLGEPFFTTKPPGEGTGLGLATVFSTVRAMRGSWEVESRPDHGTTFSLRFPAGSGAGEEKPAPLASREPLPARVLVVDDEPLVRQALRRMLERHQATVGEAPSGDEALRLLEEDASRWDLVVLDLSMPGKPGGEVLTAMKVKWPSLPVIILSGNLGATPFPEAAATLSKPLQMRELLAACRAALGGAAGAPRAAVRADGQAPA